MYKVFFTLGTICLLCQSCQRFEALNNPDILVALTQDKPLSISKKTRTQYQNIQLQEAFKLPLNCGILSLSDLFGISIHNNPNIGQTWQDARSAASRYSASLANYLPNAKFVYCGDAIRSDTPFGNATTSTRYTKWGPKLILDYLIFDFGQRSYSAEAYYQLLQSSNLAHKQILQATLQKVANNYYNYIYYKEQLKADIDDLANYKENLKAAEKKATLGIVGRSDTLLAKSKYLNAKITVVNQEASHDNAFLELVQSIGISPTTAFEVKGFDEAIMISDENPDKKSLIEIAKNQRPDYLQKKALVLSYEANLKSIRAQHLPIANVCVEGSSNNYSTGLKNALAYDINLNLSFPLFTGFLITNETREAESKLKSAVSSLRINELLMIQQVYSALNDICSFQAQLALTQEYLDISKQEHAIILVKYKKGVATILDLLQASGSLSDARARMIQAKKGYFKALTDLSYATGTLTNAKN